MTLGADDIYALLPAIHRTRDAEAGGPLRALIGVIAEQVAVLDADLRGLYADQFIETCAAWVVPYIGDLIGWRGLFEGIAGTAGSRAEVANTVGYRRRKGTLIALEQIGRDVTGRPVRATEFFRRLVTNQSLHHPRLDNLACADLRDGAAVARRGGAFDTLNRSVDVRRIAPRMRTPAIPDSDPLALALHGGGRFNIPNIGAHVWRWRSYKVTNQPAFALDRRRFLFSPLGNDMNLFNLPPPRESFARLTTGLDVPRPIQRREFHDDKAGFYGADRSLLVTLDGRVLTAGEISVCSLDDWRGGWAAAPAGMIAIDPLLGRIAVAADLAAPHDVRVAYCYGLPDDLGGGPYDRTPTLNLPPHLSWQVLVGRDVGSLADAVGAFNAQAPGTNGLIVVPDYEVLKADLAGAAAIRVGPATRLWIVAAHPLPGHGWIATDARPTLVGDIEITGSDGAPSTAAAGSVVISGLLVSGALRITGAPLVVAMQDCTLVPGIGLARDGRPLKPGAPSVVADTVGATVELNRCIAGPLLIHPASNIRIISSIIDAGGPWDVALAGPDGAGEAGVLHVEDSTIIGKARTHMIELASNTIFLARRARHDPWKAAVWSTRRQAGCVRFCFVPDDAITPAQFRCLPGIGTASAVEDALEPRFVSRRYGDPSYCLLSCDCPVAIWRGADDESQIGAYRTLFETQAVTNLQTRLTEYLPFGLEAGIFLVPCGIGFIGFAPPYTSGARHPGADDDDLPHGVAIGGMLI